MNFYKFSPIDMSGHILVVHNFHFHVHKLGQIAHDLQKYIFLALKFSFKNFKKNSQPQHTIQGRDRPRSDAESEIFGNCQRLRAVFE